MKFTFRALAFCGLLLSFALFGLVACSSGPDKPKPADLGASPTALIVRQAWTNRVGNVGFALDVKASGSNVYVASSDGTVLALDARTGGDIWRTKLNGQIAAGVGSDGRFVSVVTSDNDLVTLDTGREIWRQKLGAYGYTAPLVAGGRVFVLSADRTVSAFDAGSGRKIWSQTRSGDPLVLRQASVLLAFSDTLIVGQAGKLVGLNPLNGVSRWEVSVGTSRGTNDVERLVDLVGRAARDGDLVCARAFQANVGCVNATKGSLMWVKAASGANGLGLDDRFLFGTESNGTVVAWRRSDGDRAWINEKFQFRELTGPTPVGRAISFGESNGNVHFLAREDGAMVARVSTDGSAIVAAPTLANETLIVVTKNGAVFGFKPQ